MYKRQVVRYGINNQFDFAEHPAVIQRGEKRTINICVAVPDLSLIHISLTNFESRATIDVDFLLRGYSNSIDNVKDLICKIIDTPTGNDYIEMRAKGFEEISPQRKYHGISTQIIAQIQNVRVPFNVDIGVGDIIVPRAEERTIDVYKRQELYQ